MIPQYSTQATGLPNELKHFKERERRWLWAYLNSLGASLPFESSVNQGSRESFLVDAIGRHPTPEQLIQDIIRLHKNELVDSNELLWLREDSRTSIWGFFYLLSCNFQMPYSQAVPGSRFYDETIYTLDTWLVGIDQKIQFLHTAKQQWAIDRTPDQFTKWIDYRNHEQLKWAWEYLIKSYRAVGVATPVTVDELYAGVLASFDQMTARVIHPAEKQVFIEKMKKTWTQKVYRASESAKKPYNMPLKKATIDMLEKLAAIDGVKAHDIVDALIREAYEKREGKNYPAPHSE